MEKNFMCSDSLVELEFLTEQNVGIHYHENFELLYLMNGKLEVKTGEERFHLNPRDMMIINTNRNHSYEGSKDLLIARFLLSYAKIREMLGQSTILFWCNSSTDKNEAYEELRGIIARIFNQSLKRENGKIYLNSLYYQMLHILTSNFLLTAKDIRYETEKSEGDDRIQEVFAYIRGNYKQNISLQDIAEQLYLSTTYLSKYIKRKCNVSFIELINTVRLGHAMEDLMYTEASVMKIAMDNGFASVAAYNKAFKDAYKMTPSEFRRTKLVKKEKLIQEKNINTQIHKQVEAYLDRNPIKNFTEKEIHNKELHVDVKETSGFVWKNNCGRMINVGTSLDLTKSVFQEQILSMKERMGFEYVRFWDIYAPEMYIDIHAPKDKQHFGQLDSVLDFLVKHKLKPYIELGFKPLRLLKTTQNALKEVHRDKEFESDVEMRVFYEGIMEHILKRYGEEEVQNWYFEYWEKEELVVQTLSYKFEPMSKEGHERYFHKFDILAAAFRKYLPEIRLGGGGFPLQHYGKDRFSELLSQWREHKEQPDFISLTCYPYKLEKDGDVYYERRSTDADFVLHNLEIAREAMEETGFCNTELHVSEYSLSLSNRNAVNDSCIKGAFLMQNAIACNGAADILGHWLFTDTYADYQDSQDLLFGGCGLLSKNGIPKPGFYTFEFLNHLYRKIIAKEKYCLITENDRGSFRIVCHNFKELNYNYYMSEENEIHITDIPALSDNREYLTIHLMLNNMNNGVYAVKQNRINQSYGSIQDEWNELNMEPELSMREQDYLKNITSPKLSIHEVIVTENRLEFDMMLKPNEIQYLHISVK